ncbi:MAG TPA: hypothetical protein VGL70_13615 [Candidatus Binatia bacterium]|jgi:hypothetical protein
MNPSWIVIAVLGLLLCLLSQAGRRVFAAVFSGLYDLALLPIFVGTKSLFAGKSGVRDDRLARLEEVLRAAELTNNSFFRSLEMVQKNLEAVILRAENTEQRLHNLLTQTDLGKPDQYSSAALLLAEGKGAEQVAKMLGLPLQQVQLVHKLRQAVKGDDKPIESKPQGPRRGEKKLEEPAAPVTGKKRPAFPAAILKGENGAAHREKDAALQR